MAPRAARTAAGPIAKIKSTLPATRSAAIGPSKAASPPVTRRTIVTCSAGNPPDCKPLIKLATRGGAPVCGPGYKKPTCRICADRWESAASGHALATPPIINVTKSRRLIAAPDAQDGPSYRFKRGPLRDVSMSALGQKQTCAAHKRHVRFTPKSGHGSTPLFWLQPAKLNQPFCQRGKPSQDGKRSIDL